MNAHPNITTFVTRLVDCGHPIIERKRVRDGRTSIERFCRICAAKRNNERRRKLRAEAKIGRYIPIPQLNESEATRFWAMVERRGPDDCWPWLGTVDRHGRGGFHVGQRMLKAPRIAWSIASGRNPDEQICHHCDNPNCVNPAHLWLGTQHDNMLDASAKRKWDHMRRSHCPRGHSMENAYIRPDGGGRQCRTCFDMRNKARCSGKARGK